MVFMMVFVEPDEYLYLIICYGQPIKEIDSLGYSNKSRNLYQ